MTTWTFKGPLTAVVLMLLAGCDTGPGLTGASGGGGAAQKPPLSQANMAGGVTLAAPAGFCIDRTSLGALFAVMARCDTLGAPSAAGNAPLGLITVSLTPATGNTHPTATDIAAANGLVAMRDVQTTQTQTSFRAQGRIPVAGLSPLQWRGSTRLADHMAGIALYGPANGEAISLSGRAIVTSVIERSRTATNRAQ